MSPTMTPRDLAISPIALVAGRESLFSTIMDLCDWAASHGRAAAEAAYRGEQAMVGVHLRDARNALIAAFKVYNAIAAGGENARAA